MSRQIYRCRFWILMLVISIVGTGTLSGCFVDADHGHDHDRGWHDDHHDDHHDWH